MHPPRCSKIPYHLLCGFRKDAGQRSYDPLVYVIPILDRLGWTLECVLFAFIFGMQGFAALPCTRTFVTGSCTFPDDDYHHG